MSERIRPQRSAAILRTHIADPQLSRRLVHAAHASQPPHGSRSADKRAIGDVASWTAAPFFVGFTSWVIQTATELGINRLYFLARDGQLPLRVAEELRESDSKQRFEYLFVSRRACSLPSLVSVTPQDILWLVGNSYLLGPSKVLERLQLDTVEARAHFADIHPHAPVDVTFMIAAASEMAQGRVAEQLMESAERQRPTVQAYLRQTGFLDPGPVGVVDLGGIGSHIRALARFRQQIEGPVVGFLVSQARKPESIARFAMISHGSVRIDHPKILSYLKGPKPNLSSDGSAALQVFCAADHGSVLGYTRHIDRVSPTCGVVPFDEPQALAVAHFQASVLRAVREFRNLGNLPPPTSMQPAVIALIDDFALHPTVEEARTWSSHPMESTSPTGNHTQAFARAYRAADLATAVRTGSMPGGWTRWHYGSLRMTPVHIRVPLLALRRLRHVVRTTSLLLRSLQRKLLRKNSANGIRTDSLPPSPFTGQKGLAVSARDLVRLRHALATSPVLRTTWPAQFRLRSPRGLLPPLYLSLDVFDTVMTRSVLPPPAVMALLAREVDRFGVMQLTGEQFVTARQRAYRAARRTAGSEPTIEAIYERLRSDLEMPKAQIDSLVQLELNLERRISRPITPMQKDLKVARRRFGSVTFISDMHLPSIVIKSLLEAHGIWHDGDEIWVSAEAGADKRSGALFRMVSESKEAGPRQWLHVGDDTVADQAVPRWMGWNVAPYTTAVPTAPERVLSSFSSGSNTLLAQLAGAHRVVRLSQHPETINSTGRACPVIVAYALWLLAECANRRTDELLVSRQLQWLFVKLSDRGVTIAPRVIAIDEASTPRRAAAIVAQFSCSSGGKGLERACAHVAALLCNGNSACRCECFFQPDSTATGPKKGIYEVLQSMVDGRSNSPDDLGGLKQTLGLFIEDLDLAAAPWQKEFPEAIAAYMTEASAHLPP